MRKNKLLVFCLDALCSSDLKIMKELPNFKLLFENGSYVEHVESVYPSLTYPAHVSILTGTNIEKHGIYHNEILKAGKLQVPVFNDRQLIKGKLFTDYAKEHGYQTCSLSWPVTGHADIDLNMPMIVPINYHGNDPLTFMKGFATDELIENYYWKYSRYLKGNDRSLDLYTMALAPDIIRDYHQPDVMLVKMCDLDTVRHNFGVYGNHVDAQLLKHDNEFGVLVESIKRYGDFANTNFIVLGDHGQTNIDHILNINVILRQHGFITVNDTNEIVAYDAYCHSCSLSAWIELRDPNDTKIKKQVYELLNSLKNDPEIGIGHLYTKEEAQRLYHLTGPFDFIIEGAKPIAFGSTYLGDDIFSDCDIHDYKTAIASHGGLPFKDETTTMIACGPMIKQGIRIERKQLVDIAPTMARILGFAMNDIDGQAIDELFKIGW